MSRERPADDHDEIGVTVVNCSRRTALTTFPCTPLKQELARLQEQAA